MTSEQLELQNWEGEITFNRELRYLCVDGDGIEDVGFFKTKEDQKGG